MALGKAFMDAGYLFPLIAGTEAVAGMLLLSNRFVPLALALLAIEVSLAWTYRSVYQPMLAGRVAVSRAKSSAHSAVW